MNTPAPAAGRYAPWQFTLVSDPPAPFAQTGESELEHLKNSLLEQSLAQVATTDLTTPLRRAANEAAALAWLEPDPLFVFPALFEEKVAAAKRRAHKQVMVKARSSNLFATAE